MKESMFKNIKLSIDGRDICAVLTADNTRAGGKEAYQASKVIEQLFLHNERYDTLTYVVVDRKDPQHTLWCFKLQLHDDLENLILDMTGGEFLSGLSE